MASRLREYDVVLYGATGFTGKYIAEHISRRWPTSTKWAIAGRNHQKLSLELQRLKELYVDRDLPALEVADLNEQDLHALVKKTKLLISSVGPYSRYGEPVIAAAAFNGTHYLDVTGEAPWVAEMIRKYQEPAKASGAIIIPQCAINSVPADVLSLLVTKKLREDVSLSTKELLYILHTFDGSPSGGSIASILDLFDKYSVADIKKAMMPQAMCPIAPPKVSEPLATRLLGVRTIPGMGTVATSPTGGINVPIVTRSWALLREIEDYGPGFTFKGLASAKNSFLGILSYISEMFFLYLLAPALIRWILRKLVPEPGQGSTSDKGAFESQALAIPDSSGKQKAWGRLRWDGNLYKFTGVLVSEAAATILSEKDIAAKKLGCGFMTPATLGLPYIERLNMAGVRFETKSMEF